MKIPLRLGGDPVEVNLRGDFAGAATAAAAATTLEARDETLEARDDAANSAAAAQLWAQTIGQAEGIFLSGDAIVTGIAYPIAITGPAAQVFGYINLRVAAGTGSITVALMVGDTIALEDLTFNAQGPAQTINLAVPAETIVWMVITAITGAPTVIVGRIQGA